MISKPKHQRGIVTEAIPFNDQQTKTPKRNCCRSNTFLWSANQNTKEELLQKQYLSMISKPKHQRGIVTEAIPFNDQQTKTPKRNCHRSNTFQWSANQNTEEELSQKQYLSMISKPKHQRGIVTEAIPFYDQQTKTPKRNCYRSNTFQWSANQITKEELLQKQYLSMISKPKHQRGIVTEAIPFNDQQTKSPKRNCYRSNTFQWSANQNTNKELLQKQYLSVISKPKHQRGIVTEAIPFSDQQTKTPKRNCYRSNTFQWSADQNTKEEFLQKQYLSMISKPNHQRGIVTEAIPFDDDQQTKSPKRNCYRSNTFRWSANQNTKEELLQKQYLSMISKPNHRRGIVTEAIPFNDQQTKTPKRNCYRSNTFQWSANQNTKEELLQKQYLSMISNPKHQRGIVTEAIPFSDHQTKTPKRNCYRSNTFQWSANQNTKEELLQKQYLSMISKPKHQRGIVTEAIPFNDQQTKTPKRNCYRSNTFRWSANQNTKEELLQKQYLSVITKPKHQRGIVTEAIPFDDQQTKTPKRNCYRSNTFQWSPNQNTKEELLQKQYLSMISKPKHQRGIVTEAIPFDDQHQDLGLITLIVQLDQLNVL